MFKVCTLQLQIIGGLTDNLNINERRVQIKGGGGLKNVLGEKWQPVITNYGCPKQLLIVEKHQHNFSCSLHLYTKQNRTFLIINLGNVKTKSCLRNQTRVCINLLVFLVPCSISSISHVLFGVLY